jgi:hypothetical protein
VGFIHRKATHTFAIRVRGREVKQHVLMGSHGLLNEALNQVLKMEAAKAAAGTQKRLTVRQNPRGNAAALSHAPQGRNNAVD